jgi:hypothetical protein
VLSSLGGEGAEVEYRGVGFFELIWRDVGLRLQVLISVVTFVASIITAYNTYLKNGKDTSDFTSHTAFVAVVLAFVLALAKLYKDYNDL